MLKQYLLRLTQLGTILHLCFLIHDDDLSGTDTKVTPHHTPLGADGTHALLRHKKKAIALIKSIQDFKGIHTNDLSSNTEL